MAAGLGFKDFVTGEVLTAADVDGYLMQGIWVFANAAARDAAVTSPQEGNACYLKDTDAVMTYSGSAWVAQGSVPTSYGLSAGKNIIINGGMDIWQRGTTFTATANLTYLADRWYNSTGTTLTVTRDTDVPTSPYFQYSLKMVGTGTNSIAMRIESANTIPLAGQTITFSFYAKRTSGAGALSVNFYYPSATDNFTSVTQIGSSNVVSSSPSSSWTRYQVSVAIGTNITTGLLVLIDNTNASTTFITGAQLELGSTATTFSRNASTIGGELISCQRYYTKSYNQAVVPGTGDTAGKIRTYSGSESTGALGITVYIPPMRTAPTITSYDDLGASGKCFKGGNGATATIGSVSNNAVEVVCLDSTNTREFYFYFTASAEL
jgi:hypothetical protein